MRQFHLAEMEYYVDLADLAWGGDPFKKKYRILAGEFQ
jgi:hypothetical protein